MSGALAERVFAQKIGKVGFTGLDVVERRPFGIDDAARYPLFTHDVIELMRDLVPADTQDTVAVAVTLIATKPGGQSSPARTPQDEEQQHADQHG